MLFVAFIIATLTFQFPAVMSSIVDAQRTILISPEGTNVWSGQEVQSLNSAAVTWALAKYLYGPDGPYIWIPLGLIFGMVPTVIQWLIWRVCLSHFIQR